MIVPMKKITVIVQTKDETALIDKLGTLGLLHIEHIKAPSGSKLGLIKEDLHRLEEVLRILELYLSPERKISGGEHLKDWRNFVIQVMELANKIKELEEDRYILEREIDKWEEWGDFEPDLIKELREKNIFVKLYQIPVKELKNLPEDIVVKEVSVHRGLVNCLLISRKEINLSYPEISLPACGLKEMKKKWEEIETSILSLKNSLKEKIVFIPLLKKIKANLEKEKEFLEVIAGMGKAENLSYLRGYIPSDSADYFLSIARKEGWGVVVEDPSPEDNVPTLLRNPRWVSILNPLFKLLEIFPGYREVDISLLFLIFLSLFFGILIGDAGYGTIYLILTFLAKKKWQEKIKDKAIFSLFYILSLSAIIWGLLTGTIFGQEWTVKFFKPIVPYLRNEKIVQSLCFFLGSLHLSIAHFWKFLLKLPHPSSLAELGWISFLWGVYFLARMLILGDSFPEFAKFFFISGFILVLFFTQPQRNVIKSIRKGLGALLLNLVNSFTDVVSYIRLFAVGLASVAIADSFNRMAMDFGVRDFFSGLIVSFILVLGHTLNILLGPMSVLVHGVRLNLLEFCNHLEVKWLGFPYKPLKK